MEKFDQHTKHNTTGMTGTRVDKKKARVSALDDKDEKVQKHRATISKACGE